MDLYPKNIRSHWLSGIGWLAVAALVVMCITIGIEVLQVGFWRHDAWGYTNTEFPEFHSNARWAAPFAHYLFGWIPHSVAWLASMAMLWMYFYIFLCRFFGSDEQRYRPIILALPCAFVLQPGLLAQLFWPLHSLCAIAPLFLASCFTRTRHNYLAFFVGTVASFSVLQTFAFLAIFMAIPGLKALQETTTRQLARQLVTIWALWVASILLSAFLAKALQYAYFGEVPKLEDWRGPKPAASFADLLMNANEKYHQFISHFGTVAGGLGLAFTPMVLAAITVAFNLKHKSETLLSAWLLITGLILSAAIYIATIPDGVFISTRTTLLYGGGAILFFLCLATTLRRKAAPLVSLIPALVALAFVHPYTITRANADWFHTFTDDVATAIDELEEGPPNQVDKVVINIQDVSPQQGVWPVNYDHILPWEMRYVEGMNQTSRIHPAFLEKGYDNIIWCNSDTNNPDCEELKRLDYNHCSSANPSFCSAGITDRKWHLRF